MKQESPLRNRVKELRARLGVRQADLARDVGITRQTIIAIEKGRLNPSILICLKISRLLREPVDYVFYLTPGWEAEGGTASAEATEEGAAPKASPRVRVSAPPKPESEGPPVAPEPEAAAAPGAERAFGAHASPDEQPGRVSAGPDRFDVERDAEAGALDDSTNEDVPGAVLEDDAHHREPEAVEEIGSGAKKRKKPEHGAKEPPEPEEAGPPTGTEKQGQAIWDFF